MMRGAVAKYPRYRACRPFAEAEVVRIRARERLLDHYVLKLNSLGDPERVEPLALTWLGRGDYGKDERLEALEEASRIHDERRRIT